MTRHTVAIGQALTSALLIHLSGGRIETHFHIFGSLAFLAFYRDLGVLVSATVVIALDHAVRGVFWPQSVYGVAVLQPWRWIEHSGWILFEDIFLAVAIAQSLKEMRADARRQAELESARDAALAASRAKSEFLSSMSHEIRTPMNAILGMTEVLVETRLDRDQHNHLKTIIKNGQVLAELINGILDLATFESGRLTLIERKFNLPQVTEKLCDSLRSHAHRKRLELTVSIAEEARVDLFGDHLRLRQILINLIGNAIKFTERGHVSLRIERVENDDAEEGSLRFAITDTGIGLSPQHIENIFTNFTQADSSNTRKYGGAGLGLALTSRLVELMGGRIWLASELGRGSTFYFTAPFRIAPPMDLEIPQSETTRALPPSDDVTTRHLRVLVVDDSADNRLVIKTYLKSLPWELAFAENGAEAISSFTSSDFDVVLMDIQMPVMDGDTATRAIREWERRHGRAHTPVIALTASAIGDDRRRTIGAGCDMHLTKPVKKGPLIAAIHEALEACHRARGDHRADVHP